MTTLEIRVENSWEGRKLRHGAQFERALSEVLESVTEELGLRL